MPWVIHRSGKTDAAVCIHPGRSENTKYTPDMNCSTITIGVMTAFASCAERGSAETPIPRTVPAAVPSR